MTLYATSGRKSTPGIILFLSQRVCVCARQVKKQKKKKTRGAFHVILLRNQGLYYRVAVAVLVKASRGQHTAQRLWTFLCLSTCVCVCAQLQCFCKQLSNSPPQPHQTSGNVWRRRLWTFFFFLPLLCVWRKTHLNVLAEHVVGVQDHGAKVPHRVELEHHLDRLSGPAEWIIAPADPIVT